MAHARPFSTPNPQDLSNGIKNTTRQGVLTPAIELRSFRSPGGLPSPHFGSVSFILTLFQKWGCDIGNTLFVDNMPYRTCITLPFNAIFVESYEYVPKNK
jgi:hypothetical protein